MSDPGNAVKADAALAAETVTEACASERVGRQPIETAPPMDVERRDRLVRATLKVIACMEAQITIQREALQRLTTPTTDPSQVPGTNP